MGEAGTGTERIVYAGRTGMHMEGSVSVRGTEVNICMGVPACIWLSRNTALRLEQIDENKRLSCSGMAQRKGGLS